jgi:bifunctional enzyme CysN/CysC
MSETKLTPGRSYMMRIGTRWVPANIVAISHKIDVNTLKQEAGNSVSLNEIALLEIQTAVPVAFDPYTENRGTGAFILVDRTTNETAAAGMVVRSLRRATNVYRENLAVDKATRAGNKYQKPVVLWFTGLSGSGKSSIARVVERKLNAIGHHTYMLDGDNIRHGLNSDLGFTQADRDENIRRVGEVAKLFVDAGIIVLCSFISPYRRERDLVRSIVEENEFIEIFVDTPLEECERRDTKGLYKRARAGEIENFTGILAPYEEPVAPELHLKTLEASAEKLADSVLAHLRDKAIAGENWASP